MMSTHKNVTLQATTNEIKHRRRSFNYVNELKFILDTLCVLMACWSPARLIKAILSSPA